MRTLWCLTVILVLSASAVRAQVQERKLLDRLLEPNMSLQNSAQNKVFTPSGTTVTKQAQVKSFYVSERPPEPTFTNVRAYHAPTFDLRKHRFTPAPAQFVTTSNVIPRTQTPYSTASYREVKRLAESDRIVEAPIYPDSKPFLAKGKSQKALSQQDRPLTIDQVRDLLNKNK